MSSKRTASIEEKKNRRITGAIIYYLEVEGYSKADFAKLLGISLSTLYNRMQKPDTFSIKEQTIADLLGWKYPIPGLHQIVTIDKFQ